MDFTIDEILLASSILLFLSIIGSKASGKLEVPVLILFLGIGILAGSEGIGGIYFDDPKAAQSLGAIALVFILFSGGMDTSWESIKPILWRGISLSTLGVFLTAITVGLLVSQLFDFTMLEGMLLGSIISSTDAAAVFSILRSKNTGLKRNLRPTLELESGSNDPMAFFLTISFTALLANGDTSLISLVPTFFIQMTVGGVGGYLMGKVMVWILNRINLAYEGLYSVLLLSMVLFTYSAINYVNGNGFLAIYLAGVVLGNNRFIHKKSLLRFYDGIAWLMQILMFLTLGLLVFPSRIVPIIGFGLAISAILILVARPIGVFISLAFFKMSAREKLFISWVGLRGAVPIVFATYPLLAGIEKANIIFNIVFFIVVTSVLLQGTTLTVVAKWLRLSVPEKLRRKSPLELEMLDGAKTELVEVEIPKRSNSVGKSIVELGLPKTSLIVMINRENKYITPNGSTKIEAGDQLLILTDNGEEIGQLHQTLDV